MANIKVAVRIRPISERELRVTGSDIVVQAEMDEISLTNLKVSSNKTIDSRERTKRYRFDYCFDSSDPISENYADQMKIYETLGQSVVNALFTGYNSCLIAYGQSASGKTYTMMGTKNDPGLIPRICDGLFLRAINEKKNSGKMSRISVSYLEVYNERVRDLLVPATNLNRLKVREHPRLGPYVHGLIQYPVDTLESLMSRVEEGSKARKTASTLQNLASSRSHALLTLSVDLDSDISAVSTGGLKKKHFTSGCRLHLVDLAGSENSTANDGINRLKSQEGANINKSLVALGNVISALAERSSSTPTSTRRFIPYRDSTLTWLLKDSLGGNATTIMLATVSPASGSYNETSHTLRFAQRAQNVINKPIVNENPVAKIIRELRDEVEKLKALLLDKNIEPINNSQPICSCQRNNEQTSQQQSLESPCSSSSSSSSSSNNNNNTLTSLSSNSPAVNKSLLGEIHEKWNSPSDSANATSQLELLNPTGYVRPLEFISGFNDCETFQVGTNYHRAEISELIEDKVDEPVFVDIPTLVAVLIKPDNTIEDPQQIEEISNDGILEDNIDTDFNEVTTVYHINPLANSHVINSSENTKSCALNLSIIGNVIDETNLIESPHSDFQIIEDVKDTIREELQLSDSCLHDIDIINSESLTIGKCQTSTLPDGSHVQVDKQVQVNTEESNKINNIIQSEDKINDKIVNKLQREKLKGINGRKLSIENIKRRTSKDSTSSNSKDDQILFSDILNEKSRRKNSLDPEQYPSKSHTIIQRARRADIVAAVTERLYSSKKTPEEINTAFAPASDIRSRENSEVTLGTSTRMRLQEISRKMLAKRRRICVDTQTDSLTPIRVKDASISVREPKIIQKDASVLTDRHENYDILLPCNNPVLRVKEISTSTSDSPPPKRFILMKDASNVTEKYDAEDEIIDFHQQDSGNVSDIFVSDLKIHDNENLSDACMSNLFPKGMRQNIENSEMIGASSNTDIENTPVSQSAQTKNESDIDDAYIDKCCESKYIKPHSIISSNSCKKNINSPGIILPTNNSCLGSLVRNFHCCPNTFCQSSRSTDNQSDKSIISITLPDMISITIESPNVVESKIQVFDGNDCNEKDVLIQTDEKKFNEANIIRDYNFQDNRTSDSGTSTKSNGNQGDIKTFRIENIFQNPHESFSRISRDNENSNELDKNIHHINSAELTIRQINDEDSPSHNLNTFKNFPSLERKLDTNELTLPNTTFQEINNENYLTFNHSLMPTLSYHVNEQISNNQEITSWRDIHEKKSSKIDDVVQKLDELKFTDKIKDNYKDISNNKLSKNCYSIGKVLIKNSMDDNIVFDCETNFSDDSLDAKNSRTKRAFKEIKTSGSSISEDITDVQCPPDVVAHTKKETIDSLGLCHNTFISDDLNDTYVDLPNKKLGILSAESSPRKQNFESLIVGIPLIPMDISDEDSPTNIIETIKKKKKVSFERDDINKIVTPTIINHEFSDLSRDLKSHQLIKSEKDCADLFMDKCNFENSTSRKSILDEYMKEAIEYMRNINSMKQLTNIKHCDINEKNDSGDDEFFRASSSVENKSINNDEFEMEIGPYDKCLMSIERLEKFLSQIKRHDEIFQQKYCMGTDASAETKFHLANFSPDTIYNCWSCSRLRNYSSLDDLNKKNRDIENDILSQRNYQNSKYNVLQDRHNDNGIDEMSRRKISRNYSQLQNNLLKKKKSIRFNHQSIETIHKFNQHQNNKKSIKKNDDYVNIYPILTENEDEIIARVQKSLPSPRCTISKYDSSNDNSSSNDEFNPFIRTIDQIKLSNKNIKYSTSPRIKCLQLLSERRKVIENTRKTNDI